MRLAKKLGFKGYSELKYYLTSLSIEENEDKKDEYDDSNDISKEVFNKIIASKKIFIYGNGDYEEIISLYIKKLLLNLGILAETYKGKEEIIHFNKNLLNECSIFIVDLSNNDLARNILVNISNIDSFKIFVGKEITKHKLYDYNININKETKDNLEIIGPSIKELEEFFLKFSRYRGQNENI